MPAVSVVITTFNRADLLPRAIRSILRQTMGDFELIGVDDGSTDTTSAIVHRFGDPRIIYAPRPHRGVSAARNEAIRHSTAPYVAFLDSDDEWEPTKLQVQLDHFARLPENVGIVYSACIDVDGSGRVVRIDRPPAAGRGYVFERLLVTQWITFSTIMARREVFDTLEGFHEGLISGSDREWLLRVSRRYAFDFVPEPLARYRFHPGTMMRDDLRARIVFTEMILKDYAAELRTRPRVHARKYVTLGYLYLRLDEPRRARQAFRRAVSVTPGFLPAYFHLALSSGGWRWWRRISETRKLRSGRGGLVAL